MPSPQASSRKQIEGKTSPRACAATKPRNETAEHALKPGDTVVVFAIASFGPYIEGSGVIEAFASTAHRYYIKFVGDPTVRLRFINPDWQALPDFSLALLREFWRTNRSDDPFYEDFFPDNRGTQGVKAHGLKQPSADAREQDAK